MGVLLFERSYASLSALVRSFAFSKIVDGETLCFSSSSEGNVKGKGVCVFFSKNPFPYSVAQTFSFGFLS